VCVYVCESTTSGSLSSKKNSTPPLFSQESAVGKNYLMPSGAKLKCDASWCRLTEYFFFFFFFTGHFGCNLRHKKKTSSGSELVVGFDRIYMQSTLYPQSKVSSIRKHVGILRSVLPVKLHFYLSSHLYLHIFFSPST